MRRLFLIGFFLLNISLVYANSRNAFAYTCTGDCFTDAAHPECAGYRNQCGPAGGCFNPLAKCLNVSGNGIDWSCFQTDPNPPYGQLCLNPITDNCHDPAHACTNPNHVCEADGVCRLKASTCAISSLGCGKEPDCKTANTKCERIDFGVDGTRNFCMPCSTQNIGPVGSAYGGPVVTVKQLISIIYRIMVPVSIGFGLYFIILAGYKLSTSQGDPIVKKDGMEQLTAAIIGTLFVVISLTLLNILMKSVLGA